MAQLKFGVCSSCKTPAEVYLNNYCKECNRKRARERHIKCKANGLCFCGRPNPSGKAKCDLCREREKKRYRETGTKIAVCIDCKVQKECYASGHICRECSSARSRDRRAHNRLKGFCSCGRKIAVGDDFKCERCRNWKTYYNKNAGRVRSLAWRERHIVRLTAQRKERTRNQKITILNAYGGLICACCGETHLEFLTINHLNKDGAQHRREVKNVYRWLVKNNFPPGYNVLCMNCNFADGKAEGGCPHVRERAERQAALSPAI